MPDDYSNEDPQDTSINHNLELLAFYRFPKVLKMAENFAKFIEANIPENHLKNAALSDLQLVVAKCCLALMNEFTNKKGSN